MEPKPAVPRQPPSSALSVATYLGLVEVVVGVLLMMSGFSLLLRLSDETGGASVSASSVAFFTGKMGLIASETLLALAASVIASHASRHALGAGGSAAAVIAGIVRTLILLGLLVTHWRDAIGFLGDSPLALIGVLVAGAQGAALILGGRRASATSSSASSSASGGGS